MDVWEIFYELEGLANVHTTGIKNAKKGFEDFLAFVKTFDENEFATIYTEREWRSTRPFMFEYDDISMIVVPRKKGKSNYYERFVKEIATKIGPPRTVSIVAWDDLVEH